MRRCFSGRNDDAGVTMSRKNSRGRREFVDSEKQILANRVHDLLFLFSPSLSLSLPRWEKPFSFFKARLLLAVPGSDGSIADVAVSCSGCETARRGISMRTIAKSGMTYRQPRRITASSHASSRRTHFLAHFPHLFLLDTTLWIPRTCLRTIVFHAVHATDRSIHSERTEFEEAEKRETLLR